MRLKIIPMRGIQNPLLDFYGRFQNIDIRENLKVKRIVTKLLKDLGVRIGELNHNETHDLCNNIYSELYKIVIHEISNYNSTLLCQTYQQLELLEGFRLNSNKVLGEKVAKYSEREFLDIVYENHEFYSEMSATLRFLVSIIFQVGNNGENNISKRKWGFIYLICNKMMFFTNISDFLHYGVIDYKISIDENYNIKINDSDPYDLEAYEDEMSKKYHDISTYSYKSGDDKPDEKDHFPEEYEIIERAFFETFGFTSKNMIKLLGNLWTMSYLNQKTINLDKIKQSKFFPLSIFPEHRLINELENSSTNKVPKGEITKILPFLRIQKGLLPPYSIQNQLNPSKLIKKYKRIMICPLIYINGTYIFGNECCNVAALTWLSHIKSGVFPLPLNKNSKLYKALNKYHEITARKFERDAEKIANQVLGEAYVERNILNFKRISKNFESRPECGEIDLLCINVKKKIIFVIDAKDLSIKIVPRDLKNSIRKIYGKKDKKKSYYEHLKAKSKFISDNLSEVLGHFEINTYTGWKIKEAFLIKDYFPPAFKRDPNVEFVLLSNFERYLLVE